MRLRRLKRSGDDQERQRPGRVLLAHPATQHSWAVAQALQRAGLLQEFLTSINYQENQFPYSPLRALPHRFRTRLIAKLMKRKVHIDDLSAVHTPKLWPLLLTAGKLIAADQQKRHSLDLLLDAAFDSWVSVMLTNACPDAVHCFEGSALRTFTRARRLGIIRVLDIGSDHTGYLRVMKEEGASFRASLLPARGALADERREIHIERSLANYIIVPSEYVRQSILTEGVPDSKIIMLPYGVDTRRFLPSERLRSKPKPFTLLFVGTLTLGKGIKYLLEAWAELGLPDSELLIVGGGEDHLIDHLRANSVQNVTWIGNVARYSIHEYYHRADAFVFPSLSDGFGLVVAEAMASGLPVITTSSSGAASVVRDQIDGFIVPPRNVASLKDSIRALYDDEPMRLRMGLSAREHMVQSYTWDHYEHTLSSFYSSVVFGQQPHCGTARESRRLGRS